MLGMKRSTSLFFMSPQRATVRAGLAALLASAAACAPQAPPSDLVGESAHFRLFVDRALTMFPPGLDASNGVVALETQWADVETMLKMPAGKIDYYWLAPEHIHTACGDVLETGCMWEDRMEIDAPTLPNAHELNHAYLYLRTHRRTIPFLSEGFADAIGCDYDRPTVSESEVPRPDVVAALPSRSDLYPEGALFMRYLIRTQGIDAVLRYYEQSPERRDPALFVTNFEAFWNMSFNAVWAAVHTLPVGMSREDSKICPCTLPALPTTGPLTDDPARALYWTLPDVGDDSVALTAGRGQAVQIRDCVGLAPRITGKAVLARLGARSGRYVLPPLISATVARYISDDCSGAALFHLPADFLIGGFPLSVSVLMPTAGSLSAYVAVDFPVPTHLGSSSGFREICDRCPADGGACQALAAASMMPVRGTLYGRLQVFTRATDVLPSVWTTGLDLAP